MDLGADDDYYLLDRHRHPTHDYTGGGGGGNAGGGVYRSVHQRVTAARHREEQPVAGESLWYRLVPLINFLTSSSVGIIVAILVVALVHWRGSISNMIENAMEDGIQDTIVAHFLNMCDLIRGYYQISCEIARNLLQGGRIAGFELPNGTIIGGGAAAAGGTDRSSDRTKLPPLVTLPKDKPVSMYHHGGNGMHSAKDQPHAQTMNGDSHGPISNGYSSTAQSLLHSPGGNQTTAYRKQHHYQCSNPDAEIEPAFLKDSDYPPGWLVFHPQLGVVKKDAADKFNASKQEQKRKTKTIE